MGNKGSDTRGGLTMNESFELWREDACGRMAVEMVSRDSVAVRERAQKVARRNPGKRVRVAAFRDGFMREAEDYTCVRRV